MHWIAPSEKDTAKGSLERKLWDAADQFRANSGLKAQEYSGPILGIIFLRFAQQRAKLAAPSLVASRHPLPLGEGRGEGRGGDSSRLTGGQTTVRVRVIDGENSAANDFLLVSPFDSREPTTALGDDNRRQKLSNGHRIPARKTWAQSEVIGKRDWP